MATTLTKPINTKVTPKVWQDVKMAALRRGIDIKVWVDEALREALKNEKYRES